MELSTILTRFISMVFIVMGGLKVYPPLPEIRMYMDKAFSNFAKACPTVLFGYTPEGPAYRFSVGCAELLLAIALLFGARSVKKLSCLCLMFIMGGAIQTMIYFRDFTQLIPPAVFFLLLAFLYALLTSPPKEKTVKKS